MIEFLESFPGWFWYWVGVACGMAYSWFMLTKPIIRLKDESIARLEKRLK